MLIDSMDQSLGSEEQFITRPMDNRSLSRGQVWTESLLIHQSATILKPLTDAAMWITLINSLQSDVLLGNLGSTYPLSTWQWHSPKAVEPPARQHALTHHTAQEQLEEHNKEPKPLTRPPIPQIPVRDVPWPKAVTPHQSPHETPRGLMTIPWSTQMWHQVTNSSKQHFIKKFFPPFITLRFGSSSNEKWSTCVPLKRPHYVVLEKKLNSEIFCIYNIDGVIIQTL